MARSTRRAALAAAVIILATVLTGAAEPAQDPQLSGTILFISNRGADLDGEIYAVRVNGAGRHSLSRSPRFDGSPRPSPDGRKIAFTSSRSGVIAIWVVGVNGSRRRQVTASLGDNLSNGPPTVEWAPDGKRIVYSYYVTSRRSELRVLSVNSRRSKRIARQGLFPSWSPDGTRIAYQSFGRQSRVHVVTPTGRTLWTRAGRQFSWSPDGKRIAYHVEDQKPRIVIASAAGRTIRELKADSLDSWSPTQELVLVSRNSQLQLISLATRRSRSLFGATLAWWSPDGKLIAFDGKVNRREGLYVMNVRQGRPRYLGRSTWIGGWSPTSKALLTNVDSAIETLSLTGRRRTVVKAPRTSTFGGIAYWLAGGTIVYRSGQRWSAPTDLYTATSQRVRRLTATPFEAQGARWSPDGEHIAFARSLFTADCKTICDTEIFRADSNGRNVRRLTRNRDEDIPYATSPTWSPAGDQIAFARNGPGGDYSIRVVAASGGVERVLIGGEDVYQDPAWSPDGSKIAFASDREGSGLFITNADGSGVRKLASANGEDAPSLLTWSPDGTRLAFVDFVDGETETIYVMNAKTLVRAGTQPAWSPDGAWLAYVNVERPNTALRNAEIFAVRPDASQDHPVVTDPADEYSPSWKQ